MLGNIASAHGKAANAEKFYGDALELFKQCDEFCLDKDESMELLTITNPNFQKVQCSAVCCSAVQRLLPTSVQSSVRWLTPLLAATLCSDPTASCHLVLCGSLS